MTTPSTPEATGHRRFGWIEDLVLDLRYSLRSLQQRGNRSFAAVAVLTLGLGIGAATSIFSVGNGFLNDAYPYEDVNNIWSLWINFPPNANNNQTRVMRNFAAELAKLPSIADVMYSSQANSITQILQFDGEFGLEQYPSVMMSGNAFNFLGVQPLKGRTIQPSDIASTGAPADVIVLSEAAWKRFLPGEKDPIGKVIEFRDIRGTGVIKKTVIGVMPSRFGGNIQYDIGETVWTPMPGATFDTQSATLQVRPRIRLKPGVQKAVAEAQIQSLFKELAKNPQAQGFWLRDATGGSSPRAFNTTLRDVVSSTFDPQGVFRNNIKYLSIAVGLLLMIACMNVANLQLARAAARSREIAVRLAMGAARNRLMRQLITESVVLALAGAAVGILLAYGFTKGALALMPPNTFGSPLPSEARIGMSPTVLGFAIVVAVVSGVLFGLAPAIQSTHPDLNDALKAGGRGSSGSAGAKTRAVLVIAEIAFSAMLLVVASVTLWAYVKMARVDPGYKPEGLYLMQIGVIGTDPRMPSVIDRTRQLPFIQSTSRAVNMGLTSLYTVDGRHKDENKRLVVGLVDADYVKTAGVTLIRGRNFEADEVARGDLVALIGDPDLALWPQGVDPIGKQISIDALLGGSTVTIQNGVPVIQAPTGPPPMVTVIGVVSTMRRNVSADPMPTVYVPYTARAGSSIASFAVRVREGKIPNVQGELQKTIFAMDKTLRVNLQDMGTQFDVQFQMPRFNFILFCSLATIALILAITGIYSVLSYHIVQRTREFGVRLALGANRSAILRLVVEAGGRLLGVGLVVGIAGSLAFSKILASQTVIFRVDLSDPSALGVSFLALLVMSGAALLACFIPARRATKVDPLVALRAE